IFPFRPQAVADPESPGGANDVPARVLGVVLLRRGGWRKRQIAGALALAGLIEANSRGQIPGWRGLPVELHVLSREEPLVADIAVLVDRQLRGRRRHDRAIERYRVGAVAIQGGLLAVPVEQVRAEEQRGTTDVSGEVRVEIMIEDQPVLVLRVGGTGQLRIEEGADIIDV